MPVAVLSTATPLHAHRLTHAPNIDIAPEILFGQTPYGKEVDYWSAGCILFEMLVGRAPFFCCTLRLASVWLAHRVDSEPRPQRPFPGNV